MSIGQKIKQKRTEAKMTQAQLAEALGLSTITIRQYEADKREPRYQTLEKISEVFHCDISELVDSKREARMIIDGLLDELEKRKIMRETPCSAPEYADDFVDAWDELQAPGTITQKYTESVLKYSYIFKIFNEMGIQINLTNWRKANIRYGYQDTDVRIYELLGDVEMLDSMLRDKIKDLLKNDYGFEVDDDEQKTDEEDENSYSDPDKE